MKPEQFKPHLAALSFPYLALLYPSLLLIVSHLSLQPSLIHPSHGPLSKNCTPDAGCAFLDQTCLLKKHKAGLSCATNHTLTHSY